MGLLWWISMKKWCPGSSSYQRWREPPCLRIFFLSRTNHAIVHSFSSVVCKSTVPQSEANQLPKCLYASVTIRSSFHLTSSNSREAWLALEKNLGFEKWEMERNQNNFEVEGKVKGNPRFGALELNTDDIMQ